MGKVNEIGRFRVAGLLSRIMLNLISSFEEKQEDGILKHQTLSLRELLTEGFWFFLLKRDISFRNKHDKKPWLPELKNMKAKGNPGFWI